MSDANEGHTGGHEMEMPLVLWQQDFFMNYDHFFVHISDIANPRTELLYFGPFIFFVVLFASRKANGLKVLTTLLFADWLNLLLKFVFEGDRPYWVSIDVREFKHTCESGYGFPSGHVMGSTAFIVATYELVNPLRHHLRTMRAHLLYSLVTLYAYSAPLFLFLVAQSRVHTGSHFPHQVIVGFACGVAVVYVTSSRIGRWCGWFHENENTSSPSTATTTTSPSDTVTKTDKSKSTQWQLMRSGLMMGVIGMAVPWILMQVLEVFGGEPLGSMVKARSGCLNQAGVKRTTGPLQSLAALLGVILGTSTGLTLLAKDKDKQNFTSLSSSSSPRSVHVIFLFALLCTTVVYILRNAVIPALSDQLLTEFGAWPRECLEFFMLFWCITYAIPKMTHVAIF